MPSIQRFSAFTVYVYADDHAPPHFHVVGRGFNAAINISTLQIQRGTLSPGILAEAITWAATNRTTLVNAWEDLNERD